jgi:hypothetical protein
MQYVLGNMLNGGGGLNADGLALDLQFAADKTMTARKGPTPTFTRASSATFVGSNGLIQSAAVNAARFDHDPVTLASRGLLIEESRTNSLKFSENLTNTTNWTATNQTITLADVGPDGITNSAAVLNEGTAIGQHSVRGAFGQNRPVMGAVSCTLSAFFKAGTRRYILFSATDAGANGVAMTIDTQTWSVTDAKAIGTGFTYTTNRLTNYGGGWYRAELTFTPSAATTVTTVIWGTISSTFTALDPTYVGTSSTIITYGVQLEAGSFPTSYIPTTTGSVVRSADVCSITGANFTSFYNQSEGTLLSEASIANLVGNNRGIVQIDDDLTNNFIRHVYGVADGGFRSLIRANIDTPTALSVVTGAASTIQKRVIAYAGISFASSANGAAVETATRTMPTGLNNIKIGYLFTGLFYLSGHIASIRYYKKRLPNAKLVTLTT